MTLFCGSNVYWHVIHNYVLKWQMLYKGLESR